MEPYRHTVLIYNPTAGKLRRNPRLLSQTTEAFADLRPRLAPTSGPHDATRIAQEAVRDGADLILALGGDGTINEVVNGMIHSHAALGILPAGTANVLAMELGLTSKIDRAIARLKDSKPTRITAGRLTRNGDSRHFLAMAGAGLDAQIVYDINPSLKARAGKLAYWVGGFSHITQSVGNFEARIDGASYRNGFTLASRVRNYGGDLEIASGASLRHPDFEVVMFEGTNPLRYLAYMTAVGVKLAQKMPGVRTVRAKRIELSGDVHLQVDGEYAGRLPAVVEAIPDALTLLMPPTYG